MLTHFSFFSALFPTYLLPYLSFPLRIDPLRFQIGCRKRRLNLALVFCVYFGLWYISIDWWMRAFVALGLVFFHTKPRDWLGEKSPKWPVLCRVKRKTTTPSIKPPFDFHRLSCMALANLRYINALNSNNNNNNNNNACRPKDPIKTAFAITSKWCRGYNAIPGWAGTRKVEPIWILLKQETLGGSGISRRTMQVCTSLQMTTPSPHRSVFFTGRIARTAAQPTASKHWRQTTQIMC